MKLPRSVKKTGSKGRFADNKPGIADGCVEFKVIFKCPGREVKYHPGVLRRC